MCKMVHLHKFFTDYPHYSFSPGTSLVIPCATLDFWRSIATDMATWFSGQLTDAKLHIGRLNTVVAVIALLLLAAVIALLVPHREKIKVRSSIQHNGET